MDSEGVRNSLIVLAFGREKLLISAAFGQRVYPSYDKGGAVVFIDKVAALC